MSSFFLRFLSIFLLSNWLFFYVPWPQISCPHISAGPLSFIPVVPVTAIGGFPLWQPTLPLLLFDLWAKWYRSNSCDIPQTWQDESNSVPFLPREETGNWTTSSCLCHDVIKIKKIKRRKEKKDSTKFPTYLMCVFGDWTSTSLIWVIEECP